ncbi:spinster family MFS transporter [Sphingomonas sp. MMS24-J13]|uniref:spinster family MFS transporter n=1 Tax=Sphingomonas sp. MMS24-J13 TaxID=3238686 RepID=UPI00384DBEC1
MADGSRGRSASPGWALFLLTGISICGFIDRIIMQVLVEPMKAEFHLSDLDIGLLVGLAFAFFNVVLGLSIARLAERRRRVSLVWFGTILWSIATSLCGAASSFGALLAARVGVGVGEAIGLPSTSSLLSDFFRPEKRTTAMSVLMLAPPIGAFLGSAGGAMVAQAYGWRYAFYVAAIPGFILALLLALTVREPERGVYDRVAADPQAVPPLSAVFARIWQRRSLTHLLLGSTIASMTGFAVNAFLAAFLLRRFGFSLRDAGVISGLIASLPASLSVFGSGWLADRWGRRDARYYGWIPGISLLIAAPLYALAVTRDNATMAITLLTLSAIVQYCYLGPTAGVFQNMMHPRMRASSAAFNSLVYSLIGGALGPLLIGGLSTWLGGGASPAAAGIGLAHAMAAMTIFYVWGAVHYLLATRYLRADLAAPID